MLGGGDIAAVFNGDDEETQQVMEFITSDEFGGDWAKAGGWLSPHTTFDQSLYADETTRSIAEIANNADFVPLRRLRPDAPGRRERELLDRDGRVGQRDLDRGCAEQHRRDLAGTVSSLDQQDRPGDVDDTSPGRGDGSSRGAAKAQPLRVVLGLVAMGVTGWLMFNIFLSFGLYPGLYLNSKILVGIVAVVVGVGGAALLFFFLNMAVEGLPRQPR